MKINKYSNCRLLNYEASQFFNYISLNFNSNALGVSLSNSSGCLEHYLSNFKNIFIPFQSKLNLSLIPKHFKIIDSIIDIKFKIDFISIIDENIINNEIYSDLFKLTENIIILEKNDLVNSFIEKSTFVLVYQNKSLNYQLLHYKKNIFI